MKSKYTGHKQLTAVAMLLSTRDVHHSLKLLDAHSDISSNICCATVFVAWLAATTTRVSTPVRHEY